MHVVPALQPRPDKEHRSPNCDSVGSGAHFELAESQRSPALQSIKLASEQAAPKSPNVGVGVGVGVDAGLGITHLPSVQESSPTQNSPSAQDSPKEDKGTHTPHFPSPAQANEAH